MNEFDAQSYSPPVAALLTPTRMAELGPGTENHDAFEQLSALTAADISAPEPAGDQVMALACVSGLWLYHDFLDRSHTICQDIETPTGSYWHGIMHRREPDASNAKYWFRRVGEHPIFPDLCAAARRLADNKQADGAAAFLTSQGDWDPMAFIDLAELARTGAEPQHESLCREIQLAEWQLLFDFCYRHAMVQS